jgi:hypothetical protein
LQSTKHWVLLILIAYKKDHGKGKKTQTHTNPDPTKEKGKPNHMELIVGVRPRERISHK